MLVDWMRCCYDDGMVADGESEADIVKDSSAADVREAARTSVESGPTGQRTLTARAAGRSGRDDISERVEELLRNEIGGLAPRGREACTGELGSEPDDSNGHGGPRQRGVVERLAGTRSTS